MGIPVEGCVSSGSVAVDEEARTAAPLDSALELFLLPAKASWGAYAGDAIIVWIVGFGTDLMPC